MSDERPADRVVIPCEVFMARRRARDWHRWSLLKELLANDAEGLAIVRELAEADRPRRRPGRA